MGTGRSLDKLHTDYLKKRGQSGGKAGAEKPPSTRKSTLEGWSSKFGWCDRAATWDAFESAIAEQELREVSFEWLPRRIELQRKRIEQAERLSKIADQLLAIYEAVFLSIDLSSPPSLEELKALKFLMPERWTLRDVVQMYKVASELEEQASRSGSDEIAALQVLAEAGWVPGEIIDEASDALDSIGDRIKQALQGKVHG